MQEFIHQQYHKHTNLRLLYSTMQNTIHIYIYTYINLQHYGKKSEDIVMLQFISCHDHALLRDYYLHLTKDIRTGSNFSSEPHFTLQKELPTKNKCKPHTHTSNKKCRENNTYVDRSGWPSCNFRKNKKNGNSTNGKLVVGLVVWDSTGTPKNPNHFHFRGSHEIQTTRPPNHQPKQISWLKRVH